MAKVKMLCWKQSALGPDAISEEDVKVFSPEELVDVLLYTEIMLTRILLGNDDRFSANQLISGIQALRDEAIKRMCKRTRKK